MFAVLPQADSQSAFWSLQTPSMERRFQQFRSRATATVATERKDGNGETTEWQNGTLETRHQ